jgi:hypothetical protein
MRCILGTHCNNGFVSTVALQIPSIEQHALHQHNSTNHYNSLSRIRSPTLCASYLINTHTLSLSLYTMSAATTDNWEKVSYVTQDQAEDLVANANQSEGSEHKTEALRDAWEVAAAADNATDKDNKSQDTSTDLGKDEGWDQVRDTARDGFEQVKLNAKQSYQMARDKAHNVADDMSQDTSSDESNPLQDGLNKAADVAASAFNAVAETVASAYNVVADAVTGADESDTPEHNNNNSKQ